MLKRKITPIKCQLSNGVSKILILKWSALGDIILIIPSLRAIRKHFPQTKIYLLVKEEYRDFLSELNFIDQFIDFEKANWLSLIPRLRKEEFDLSIDFQNTWRSHFLTCLGKVKNRLGYQRKGGKILLNIVASEPEEIKNPLEHQAHLLSKIGINLDNFELECNIPFKSSFQFDKPYICILPGAGEGWETKCWDELSFAHLSDILIGQLKYAVIFLGEERERKKIERIEKAMEGKTQDLIGKTNLKQLAGIIKDSSLVICHDTGPMHLAQALRVPTIALFGPTDPKRHSLPSSNLFIIKKNLSCQPCYRRECPNQQCMQLIRVEEVLEVIKKILEDTHLPAGREDRRPKNENTNACHSS